MTSAAGSSVRDAFHFIWTFLVSSLRTHVLAQTRTWCIPVDSWIAYSHSSPNSLVGPLFSTIIYWSWIGAVMYVCMQFSQVPRWLLLVMSNYEVTLIFWQMSSPTDIDTIHTNVISFIIPLVTTSITPSYTHTHADWHPRALLISSNFSAPSIFAHLYY